MKFRLRLIFCALAALFVAGVARAQSLSIESVGATPGSVKPGEAVTFSVAVNNNSTVAAFQATDTATFTITLTNTATGYQFVLTPPPASPKALIPAATAGTATSPPTPGTGTFAITVIIPTMTTEAGTYRASVDIAGGGSLTTATPVLTVTGTPDLVITKLTYPAGVAYKGGDVIPMSLSYINASSSYGTTNVPFVPGTAASSFRIEIILSTNPVFGDGDDFLLTLFDESLKRDADNSERTLTWSQLLPGNFAGSYYVMAKIDTGEKVAETTADGDVNFGNVWGDVEGARITLQPTSFPTVYMASIVPGGNSGNNYSDNPSVSADGRYTAFVSDATNLVANDTNGIRDIFLFDNQTVLVRRLSLSQQGQQSNGASANPAISGDGRFVAFASDATNLVFGDTNGFTDIFVVDTVSGVVTRESVTGTGGQASGSSFRPAISSDGRYVVYESNAANLSPLATSGITQVYLRDRTAGTTTLISQGNGAAGNGVSIQAAISGGGRYVVFASDATNLGSGDSNGVRDIFLRDVTAGTTTRVSVDGGGGEANGASRAPSLNRNPGDASDGRYIAFGSEATNLVGGDGNGVSDIFVRDRVAGTTTRVSLSTAGAEGNDPTNPAVTGTHLGSINPSISATGRYVAFASLSNNLTAGDSIGEYSPTDANRAMDVFVRDRDVSGSGTFDTAGNVLTQMASVNRFGYQTARLLGIPSTAASDIFPAISGDGRWVAFPTDSDNTAGLAHAATNRSSPDSNNFRDVFLFDRRINALPNPAAIPTVAITNPQGGSSYPVNTPLTINATAMAAVGSVAGVQFFVNGNSLGAPDTSFPYSATWTPSGMGTFTLSALVTDSFGNQGVSTSLPISVVLGAPPVVNVTSPVENSSITVNTPQTLRANATSANGTVDSVQFFANGAPVGAPVTAAPFTTTWSPAAEGVYRITATAVDNAGLGSTSLPITVLAVPSAGVGDTVFSGSFAGTGETGRFAVISVGGKDAILIGFTSTTPRRAYFLPSLTIDAGGGFAGGGTAGQPTVSASTNATGVTGSLDGGRVTFIGPSVFPTGSSAVAPGYYSGSLNGRGASTIAAIVAADGTIFVYGSDGSFQDAGAGAVTSTGAFAVTTPSGNRFTGTIDNKTGFATGTLTGGPGGTFSAALASGVAFSDGALRNLSTRGQVGTGNNILIAGFVLKGNSPKQVLLRAIGPALGAFGVTGVLADPVLQVFSGNTQVAANDNWANDAATLTAFGKAGAFSLTPGSRDSAVVATLQPGAYTAQISGAAATSGVALLELYDLDDATAFAPQKLMNVATRGVVGTGAGQQLIAGFVVSGSTSKKVLVRAAGPALASVGITSGLLADPVLRLSRNVNGADTLVRENDNWETGNDSVLVADAAAKSGAFPFAAGGRDAVLLLSLPPGTYSAQVTGSGNTGGLALIEVYEVP